MQMQGRRTASGVQVYERMDAAMRKMKKLREVIFWTVFSILMIGGVSLLVKMFNDWDGSDPVDTPGWGK